MKAGCKTQRKFFIIFVICQLGNTFCTTQLYPETSFPNIQGQAEKHMLQDFIDAGVEKMPDTGSVTPDDIVHTAGEYLGVPHCMGGTTKKCMDCSGLLVTVFAAHGIYMPHNSEEQARYGKIISGMDELQKGDLVFFVRSYKTNHLITHSGIYTGNNQFIHTSSSRGVTISSMSNSWWEERFIFGTRIFK